MTPDDEAFAAKYPLHVKAKANALQNQVISNFLDWLEEHDYVLAKVSDIDDDNPYLYELNQADINPEKLIADFNGIDLKAFNEEKDRMYQEMIAAQNQDWMKGE
jgi:hypothetical protein